jgi:hypothetical protein
MQTLEHRFVEDIPATLDKGILYISMRYRTAIHKCVCGCGNEVVTPFSPTDWELRFYGDSVSLSPSIGNWNFDCQSHYWIVKNQIRHSGKWDDRQIRTGRRLDKERKEAYFSAEPPLEHLATFQPADVRLKQSWLGKLFNFKLNKRKAQKGGIQRG